MRGSDWKKEIWKAGKQEGKGLSPVATVFFAGVVWLVLAYGCNSRLTHNRLIRFDLLLRRSGPVPGILASAQTGAIMDKSEPRSMAAALRSELR